MALRFRATLVAILAAAASGLKPVTRRTLGGGVAGGLAGLVVPDRAVAPRVGGHCAPTISLLLSVAS